MLLEAFSMAADTLVAFRYITWSSIRDTRGVTTRVKPERRKEATVIPIINITVITCCFLNITIQ